MTSHIGPVVASNCGINVIQCDCCGFAHQDPLPTQDEVDRFYAQDHFYDSSGKWFIKESHEHTQGLWDAYYNYQMRVMARGVPASSMLDVGAGAGWFVRYWQRHGPPIYHSGIASGIEPSFMARACSPVRYALEPTLEQWLERKDLRFCHPHIHLALVLEHVLDPVGFLKQYVGLMDARNRMCIVVPNEFNPLQRRVGGYWWVQKPHLNYFTPTGLQWVMQEAGLRVLHKSATFPMESWITHGLDYRGNDALGRKCHLRRLRFERAVGWRAFSLYHLLFRVSGIGRELIFVGEKV